MSIKVKILAFLCAVIALSALLNYAIHENIVMPGFLALERVEAKEDMERCVHAFSREVEHLSLLCHDWAAWDDTYEFVVDGNQEYKDANLLAGTFVNAGLNMILVIDNDGKVVWGKIIDLDTEEDLTLDELPLDRFPPGHPMLAHHGIESSISGVMSFTGGTMLFASRPIIPSAEDAPSRGTLIMGRILNDDFIAALARQTQVDVDIRALADGSIPGEEKAIAEGFEDEGDFIASPEGSNNLAVYTIFKDYMGNAALLFKANIPRSIEAMGKTTVRMSQSLMALGALLILLTLLIILKSIVIDPIYKLTKHAIEIGNSTNLDNRIDIRRNDEIGTLAKSFNNMVGQLSETRKKLMEQSYSAGIGEMAAFVLHNVRNSLTPVIGWIDLMKEELDDVPSDRIKAAAGELVDGNISAEREGDLNEFLNVALLDLVELTARTEERLEDTRVKALEIVSTLSEYEKFRCAGQPVQNLNLVELIAESISHLPECGDSPVSIEVDESVSKLPAISAARISLSEVLSEILLNAFEAVRKVGRSDGKVVVSGFVGDGVEEGSVHLCISDNGEGIEENMVDKIFDRGFTSKSDGHEGNGLHWCSNTITSIGGRVYAESHGRGQGACMHVVVPVEKQGLNRR